MRSARWSIPNAMLAGVLALALGSGGTVFGGGVFSRAWADEAEEAQRAVDDAQATLDDAQPRARRRPADDECPRAVRRDTHRADVAGTVRFDADTEGTVRSPADAQP